MLIDISEFGSPRGVGANVVDCHTVESEFELQVRYYVHFRTNTLRKNMNSLIPTSSYVLNSTTTVNNIDFYIRLSLKVDMPLNKECKPNHISIYIRDNGDCVSFNANTLW